MFNVGCSQTILAGNTTPQGCCMKWGLCGELTLNSHCLSEEAMYSKKHSARVRNSFYHIVGVEDKTIYLRSGFGKIPKKLRPFIHLEGESYSYYERRGTRQSDDTFCENCLCCCVTGGLYLGISLIARQCFRAQYTFVLDTPAAPKEQSMEVAPPKGPPFPLTKLQGNYTIISGIGQYLTPQDIVHCEEASKTTRAMSTQMWIAAASAAQMKKSSESTPKEQIRIAYSEYDNFRHCLKACGVEVRRARIINEFAISEIGERLQKRVKELGNLTHLTIANRNLTKFPVEICELTNLQTLDISHNQLRELPVEFAKLVNLQKLYINDNLLTEWPIAFTLLPELSRVEAGNNRLGALSAELGQRILTLNLQRLP